jgi:poly(A)-specific ribonuclease
MDRRTVLFAALGEEVDWERSSLTPLATSATRRLPVVVHYGFMDLCFLLTHFVRPVLPPTLPECKSLIQEYFPIVYDTKVMVDECCHKYSDVNSSLGMLFTHMTTQETDLLSHVVDVDTTAATSEQKHEAAYDAYMTGCAFLGLCDEIQLAAGLRRLFPSHGGLRILYPVQAETSVDILRYMFARNQLFQSSVYTLDLESGDRMKRGLFLESSFRLSGLDSICSMRVFMEKVQKGVDSRLVILDFSRIEDGIFLVTVNSSGKLRRGSVADVLATVRQDGLKLEKGLRSVFQRPQIRRMDDYLTEFETEKERLASSWFSRLLLVLLGFFPWLTAAMTQKPSDRKCSIRNDLVVDQSIVEEWKKVPENDR